MSDELEIKSKLISLYQSQKPQVFAQLHGDFDNVGGKITTATTRVYALRAGAIAQILFPERITQEQAIEYLQAAIRHLEVFGVPTGPVVLPDGSAID